ncbi:MAG: hypothetical protein R3F20_19080 [Planctomycetota bacterium]
MKKRSFHFLAALALAVCTSGVINAQAMGGDTTGPDVIVGAIPNISNYSAAGGMDAISVGTTSCNIGTVNLLWQASNPNHPVISQTLYKWDQSEGTFEQIGLSWLKHGFSTVNNGICGSCPGGLGSQLPPSCSDPYGSGLNGSQGGLGPRFEVNAWTGAFLYPYTGQGASGNSVYKRLQFDPSAVGGAGDRYAVECHYVMPDDAGANNQLNNSSWREITVSGGSAADRSLSLTGPTFQMENALEAWADFDSNVKLINVDVPGEGRFHVAFLLTDLGNGQFRYEFAVQNMCSDRSARGFKVYFPNGANISNVGFHDVEYHSGEPQDGTDWVPTVNGDNIAWQTTQTFAQNPNANALRWATTYNYRFTSDASPAGIVNFEIELFKPGTPTLVAGAFTPPIGLTVISGNDQIANVGENFAQPLTVQVAELGGAAVPGVNVVFDVPPGITLTNGGMATTDANGMATVMATAGNTGGPYTVGITAGDQSATIDLFVRKLTVLDFTSAGIVIFQVAVGWPNQPITLAIDAATQPTTFTSFGPLCTSILFPSASFYAETGDQAQPYGYRPQLVSNIGGQVAISYTGLQSLSGSGISLNHQAYALRYVNGLEVMITNCETHTY